jgi:hypothetical protein
MKIAWLAKALDRGDLVALVHDGERQAGIDAPAADHNGAGAALAVVTTLLRAGQVEMLAQRVEQRCAIIEIEIALPAVDGEAYL